MIRLGDLGLQFVLKSREALGRIRFLDAEPARRRNINAARADAFLSIVRALHRQPDALL